MSGYSYISVLDIFKIGVGPSSSHTTGPMVAAGRFLTVLQQTTHNSSLVGVRCILYGSLASTGIGHATDIAVMAGLLGFVPQTVCPETMQRAVTQLRQAKQLTIAAQAVSFDPSVDIVFKPVALAFHPNGMRFEAIYADGTTMRKTYFSVGGGFVVEEHAQQPQQAEAPVAVPYPFSSGKELLAQCEQHNLSIHELVRANENALRPWEQTRQALLGIWQAMQACVEKGLHTEGVLPGGLEVRRRAAALYRRLQSLEQSSLAKLDMQGMDWVNAFAMAVNEENAAGGRVVTAPTNGAAGIIPAVLYFYTRQHPNYHIDEILCFLLTAAAVAKLCKLNASISGAEVGCQGEVGSACAMAAAGLAAVLGATPTQVENAAEIGLEHNLGLSCDPVAGLVQIPCIERNAIAAVKAINASKLAIHGDGVHHISLDQAIHTMRETGRDMLAKYKETSLGGLAVAYIEC